MELNKEIRDILIEFAIIVQEEKYTNSQVLIRSTYDTFRIQNIVENLSLSDVIVPKGTFNCGQERVFGEEKCKQQCKDCLVEYNDN